MVTRLGAPPGQATRWEGSDQSVVVQVSWSESASSHGSYALIALDGRVTPPRPLAGDGGWTSEGATGSEWGGAYDALARHYDWLGGTAQLNDGTTAAVGAPATASGTVTAWFRQRGEGQLPFADVNRDIVLALVHVDDRGEVRWARRLR